MKVTETIMELAASYTLTEVSFDPWRFRSEALRLEQELGLVMVEWPQTPSRMTEASENLHRLIVEGKLSHPGDPDLDRHVAQAVAKQTSRGWRLDKADRSAQIDAAVALSMCAQRASQPEPTTELIGWL